MFSSGTNNKSVCNVIRTRPSFHSLSFGSLHQPAHIKLMGQVVTAIHRKCWKDFPSRWRIIDNRNNLYWEIDGSIKFPNFFENFSSCL